MEETISLQEIFTLLKKKATLIISAIFIGIGIAAIVTFFFITPKYSAGAQLIASSKKTDSNISTDNINSNLLMINTYKDFIKGRVVTEAASKELKEKIDYQGTPDDIEEMINVEQTENSQMFTITVTSTSPKESAEIANIVADIFKNQAKEYTDADKVSIISNAEVPTEPVSPNKKVNLSIGGVLGLIVGVGLALLSQLFNRSVKSSDYVSETLGVPILGNIPLADIKDIKRIKSEQIAALESAEHITEAIDTTVLLGNETDGLDKDLSRLNSAQNLEDTIDLSGLNITQIDLNDIDTKDDTHITPIDGRIRRSR